MRYRELSTAVEVMPWSPLDQDHRMQPTETQVREALAKVTRDLDQMAQVRHVEGWTEVPDGFGFSMTDAGDGLALRGRLLMQRPE